MSVKNSRAEGVVTVSGITLDDGRTITTQQAVDYGWICPANTEAPAGWGIDRHEIVVGHNLFLDQGRQVMAFLFGGRSPLSDYVVSRFAVGTGLTTPRVTDVALEAPVLLSNGDYSKPIDSVDYLSPFVVRVSFTLGTNDANGYIITEMGLLTGAHALVARKVRATSINKNSSFSPTLTWRFRF